MRIIDNDTTEKEEDKISLLSTFIGGHTPAIIKASLAMSRPMEEEEEEEEVPIQTLSVSIVYVRMSFWVDDISIFCICFIKLKKPEGDKKLQESKERMRNSGRSLRNNKRRLMSLLCCLYYYLLFAIIVEFIYLFLFTVLFLYLFLYIYFINNKWQ